ncbi:MAG: cytochrome d ubiquinol oxidase subunit II [Holosporales bacterium]
MELIFDYTFLRVMWWILLGVLFWGFFLMDGFDLGVASLLPIVTRNDTEKRILLNSIGPVWEGNQVWLILAAGAIFAAWPHVYGVVFSLLYVPLLVVLSSLILRPVGFKFRSKLKNATWRHFWDGCLCFGGIMASFSFGLVMAHLILGLPFHFDHELRLHFSPNPNSFFHPFALFSGFLWVFLCAQRGILYVLFNTEGGLKERLEIALAPYLWGGVFFMTGLLMLWRGTVSNYHVIQKTDSPSNPLGKIVTLLPQETAQTFFDFLPLNGLPFWVLISFVAFSFLTNFFVKHKRIGFAFVAQGLSMGSILAFMGACHFPIIVLSNTHSNHSLTLWDASSSQLTLGIMLVSAVIFVPTFLAYTAWVYKVLKGPIKEKWIQDESTGAY